MKHLSVAMGLLLGLTCVFLSFTQRPQPEPPSKPNVLFIIVDDMNGYGLLNQYPVKIPYLNKLKSQSVFFRNAVCASPVCVPSRAAMLSGLLPQHTGCYRNGGEPWRDIPLFDQIEAMPECFKRNGYTTWGNGKIFHAQLKEGRLEKMFENAVYMGGFGPFEENGKSLRGTRFNTIQPYTSPDTVFPDVKNADAAIAFLKQKQEKPFFMFYGLWRPHSPYTAPKRFFDLYDQKSMPFPKGAKEEDLTDVPHLGRMLSDSLRSYQTGGQLDKNIWQQYLWAYAANTAFADWNVGRVLEALDKSPYADNTIVVFCSDNGFNNGEKLRWGKGTLWEQSDYVPLMIRLPKDRKSLICNRPVSLIDLYPTLMDYCGLQPPAQKLDGKSLVPLLKKPDMPWEKVAFTTYGEKYSSVRTEQYRYIQYPDGTEELYDLKKDPYEWKNRAAEAAYVAIKKSLQQAVPTQWTPMFKDSRWEVNRGEPKKPGT